MRYNDQNLRNLYADLSPANRKKIIRGACGRVGNTIRKTAVNNLRSSGLGQAEELSSGIYVVVFKRKAGVRVTVAPRKARMNGKGEKGMHRNRYGEKRPILYWAETGTKWRLSKKPTKYRINGKWVSGKRRGRMKRYGFMSKTQTQVEYTAGRQIKQELIGKLRKLVEKNGCS